MKITEVKGFGWTVKDNDGHIRLVLEGGQPAFCDSKEEVLKQCNARGLYESKTGDLMELILG